MSSGNTAPKKTPSKGPKGSWIQRSKKFISEVHREVSQVVWPTRREAMIITVIVGIFAFIVSVYLLCIDNALIYIVQKLVG